MTRVTRFLLRLYPAAFRARHGDELAQTLAAAPMTAAVVRDVVEAALRMRTRQLSQAIRSAIGGGAPSLPPPSKRTAMETIVQDVRYAIRQFVHRPGFTAIAVLSLGLAIGGNSLIYGLVDGFVFRPFPFPDPDRLVAVGVAFPKVSSEVDYIETLSPPSTSTSDQRRASPTSGRSIWAIATSPGAMCRSACSRQDRWTICFL